MGTTTTPTTEAAGTGPVDSATPLNGRRPRSTACAVADHWCRRWL